jgi:tetratricopeptide (TPR) repeat protein
MPDRQTITVIIREASDGAYRSDVHRDGEPVATNRTIEPTEAHEVDRLAADYLRVFEQRLQPQIEDQRLEEIGRMLFETWLADVWDELDVRPGDPLCLVVASDVSAVLNLPWELLPILDRLDVAGLDPNVALRRYPRLEGLPEATGERRPGPLRVLYSACQPREATTLDYEREEYELMRILGRAGAARDRVVQFGCDLGSFEELRKRVEQFRPHVVHLTGHGAVHDGEGTFVFEDERGHADPVSGRRLALDCFAGSGVQCVFVSGCQTGQAPDVDAVGGICQGLVAAGVPAAVGWAASIGDDVAIRFAERFYKVLAAGRPVDRALVQARQEARALCEDRSDPSWTLPVLYASSKQADLFDPSREDRPPSIRTQQNALPGMSEGYAAHFVGRRREIQRYLPALRDGDVHTLLLTGIGGVGKSTLATRLARSLQADGFRPIAVSGGEERPFTVQELVDSCRDAFLQEGLQDIYDRLGNEDRDPWDRLRDLVAVLNEHPFVLVLDNVETLLDPETRETKNDLIRRFIEHLTTHLTAASRCLLTSRYRPAEFDGNLPPGVEEETLEDFPRSAFFKFLLADEDVERRVETGELSYDLLADVYGLLGGTPRFLDQIREVLTEMYADDLRDELDGVHLPDTGDDNALRAARDAYLEDIFASPLYHALPEASRTALSRAAVYSVPMTLEGYAAAADVDVETMHRCARQWQNRAFAYPESNEETDVQRWSIYGLLRDWLLQHLSADERRAAHEAAGAWLEQQAKDAGRSWIKNVGMDAFSADLEARARFLDAEAYESAREVTDRLSSFLVGRAVYDDVRQLNEELLDHHSHPSPMNWLGRVHGELANYDEAVRWYEETLSTFEEIGDRSGVASARANLAKIAAEQGAYDRAREQSEEALSIFEEVGDRLGEAKTRHNLASIALLQGKYDRAREQFEEVLEILREIGDRSVEASTRHQLATIAVHQGAYERAREEFEEALEIKQEIGDRSGEATTRHQLATIALRQGKYERARVGFEKSLKIEQEIGDRSGEAIAFGQLGNVAGQQGNTQEALRLHLLSYIVLSSIDHAHQQTAWKHVSSLVSDLALSQDDLEAVAQEVRGAHAEDGGWSLIRDAFPDADRSRSESNT